MSSITQNYTNMRQALSREIRQRQDDGQAAPLKRHGDQITLTQPLALDVHGQAVTFQPGTRYSAQPLNARHPDVREEIVYTDSKGGTHQLERETRSNPVRVQDRVDDTYLEPNGTNRGTSTATAVSYGVMPRSTLCGQEEGWRIVS